MKRNLITAAFLLTSTLAFAQAPVTRVQPEPAIHQRHGGNPHKAAMRMSRELGLSPDQSAKLEPIFAERRQKVDAVRADTSLTDAQRKQQLKAIHQTAKLQLSNVLTPDQMKQMHSMKRDHEAKTTGV